MQIEDRKLMALDYLVYLCYMCFHKHKKNAKKQFLDPDLSLVEFIFASNKPSGL